MQEHSHHRHCVSSSAWTGCLRPAFDMSVSATVPELGGSVNAYGEEMQRGGVRKESYGALESQTSATSVSGNFTGTLTLPAGVPIPSLSLCFLECSEPSASATTDLRYCT